MSQLYFPPARSASPAPSTFSTSEPPKTMESIQEAYVEHRDKLVHAIDSTKTILDDLRAFNKDSWVVRYPHFRDKSDAAPVTTPPAKRQPMRRSLSFADDPATETDVVFAPAKRFARSMTLASVRDLVNETEEEQVPADGAEFLIPASDASDFNVLRLDLKLGPQGSSASPASLVSQLEKSSIANLVDERIIASANHIDKLRTRIEDPSSKVLVTGDLNAGKSTFVNALLRREVMPVDQQPCTTAFCEVHDAADNDNKEEVHIIKEGFQYSISNEASFTRASISDLEQIISDNENEKLKLKVYLADSHGPSKSLLNNGVLDISLIDAPGLNRDSIKTTALFARQEEIDVVVFVVSAENHFTLSAKEFLQNASNEKAYVFVVVNKYEGIRDKNKCRRLVLDQIRQLSPLTYANAEELVHFVDSNVAMKAEGDVSSFEQLQSSLRSFVLTKREKSKLMPASTYLSRLLADIELLVGANAIVAQTELEQAKSDLARARPILEKMQAGREALEDGLEAIEEEGTKTSSSKTKQVLDNALNNIAQGKPALGDGVPLPTYPGLLAVWDYARDVRRALLASVDAAVKLAEDQARVTTTVGVQQIGKLADEHLPEGAERSKRVFIPEAMFSLRRGNKKGSHRPSAAGSVVAGGTLGLGIGLAQRHDMLETTFFDIFDAQHHIWVHFGDEEDKDKVDDEESGTTALSIVSVGIGAITMMGGNALGIRGLIDGFVRLTELWANEAARKWAAPLVGALVMGATAYLVIELPSTIPKTVGRRIRRDLIRQGAVVEGESFVDAQVGRVSRETRKVLRIASWELKERFRSAMDERGREVRTAEDTEKRAQKAMDYFREVEKRAGDVRGVAGLVHASL